MFFLKKVLLGFGFVLLFFSGSCTQSNGLFMQGMGFAGLLIGLVILYVFGRMVWKGLGCLPSFLILAAIMVFMMYALGMFNHGLDGIGESIVKFIGYNPEKKAAPAATTEKQAAPEEIKPTFSEEFPEPESIKEESADEEMGSPELFGSVEPEQPKAEENKGVSDLVNQVTSMLDKKQQTEQQPFNPNNYPVVYGSVRVITADTLEMYGKYFQLFGIDAPEANQTCANRQGRSYNCGRDAAMWLKNWIGDNELECHVIQQDTKGNMVGTCSYGPYDLGAALVNAGWAVAYLKYSDIYYPYELQAQQNRRGLWQGTFYKPWDWRKIQARKPKIKVIQPKKRQSGIFG